MRILIDFINSADSSAINAYLQEHNCTVVKTWNNFDQVYHVEADILPPVTGIVERVIEEKGLDITQQDVIQLNPYYLTHSDPNKPSITVNVNDDKDWWKNYSYINPEFNNPTMTIARLGQNIDVYIMDSGIKADHPDFVDTNIVNIYSVVPGDFSDNKGHGTAIGSLISGKTCGITEAVLKVVKIVDPGHVTLESELLDALDAIINDHEDNTFAIVNASFYVPKNEWVEHKFRVLEDEGVFIVCSAGNDNMSIEDITPASMLDVITIGAYNQQLVPCNFSNYTEPNLEMIPNATNYGELDGWAPGERIWAATLDGGYNYVQGTSFAAAITSAILASNISWFIDSNGIRLTTYENLRVSTAGLNNNNFLFSRENLLDLSVDEKYSGSVNKIATLLDRSAGAVTPKPDEFYTSIRVGETKALGRVYEPTLTKSIEFIESLPANFQLLPDGRLYGSADISQGPAGNEIYKTYVSKFIRTNLDDVGEEVTVNIYVYDENLQPDTLPTDDPIKVTLNEYYCQGLPFACQFSGEPVGCVDNCTNFYICCQDEFGKNSFNCNCGS